MKLLLGAASSHVAVFNICHTPLIRMAWRFEVGLVFAWGLETKGEKASPERWREHVFGEKDELMIL